MTTALFAPVHRETTLQDYWQLLKPGVMLLVVFTAAAGLIAAPHTIPLMQSLLVVLAIAMGSGAGAAFNMWYDADIDRVMQRTQKRPIPSGKIDEQDVLMLAIVLAIISVTLLAFASNWAAAGLLAFAIWFYACLYTMILKRTTPHNIVIGGAAGAFPPVIGWLATSPVLSLEPWCYFLIVFLWTPPHFWALALYRHEDYAKVGVPMLPVVAGEASTLRHIFIYSLLLCVATFLPVILEMRGGIYMISAVILNACFLYKMICLWLSPNQKSAISLFIFSILYLFGLFTAIIADVFFYWELL
jgi:protoheme IX farnesyltransferase